MLRCWFALQRWLASAFWSERRSFGAAQTARRSSRGSALGSARAHQSVDPTLSSRTLARADAPVREVPAIVSADSASQG
eukprot:3212531-Rhodomonas_salina.1